MSGDRAPASAQSLDTGFMVISSPWSGVGEGPVVDSWALRLSKSVRPWWGLGLIRRKCELTFFREGSEESVLAGLAEMKAEYPTWEFELRRA